MNFSCMATPTPMRYKLKSEPLHREAPRNAPRALRNREWLY